MGCIPVPRLPAPTLPSPLVLPTLSVPAIPDIDLALCCHTHLPTAIPPVSLGLVLPSAVVDALNAYIEQMIGYVNADLSAFEEASRCPFESPSG